LRHFAAFDGGDVLVAPNGDIPELDWLRKSASFYAGVEGGFTDRESIKDFGKAEKTTGCVVHDEHSGVFPSEVHAWAKKSVKPPRIGSFTPVRTSGLRTLGRDNP